MFLRVEVCVVVAALARLVVVEKQTQQVLFEGKAGPRHGPSRIPSNHQQRLGRILIKGESKYCCISIIANQTPFKTGGLQYFLSFMNERKSHQTLLS